MKKLFFFCLLILLNFNSLYSQRPSLKWVNVLTLDDPLVFVDTTNVKQSENQITAIILVQYKKPVYIDAYKKNAKSIKSQVLFNIASQKYTLLGSLYYDSKLRIIGESSLPGFSLGKETFANPIDSNKTIAAVYNKCIELLNIDPLMIVKNVKSSKSLLDLIDAERKSSVESDTSRDAYSYEPPETADSNKFIDKQDIDRDYSQSDHAENDSEKDSSEPILSYNYRTANETNPVGTIFTDGNKYCFQISSWRHKSKADKEASKFKTKGYNAFVMKAKVPGKGGTWFRVRIGYFDTLEETEEYMKRMK